LGIFADTSCGVVRTVANWESLDAHQAFHDIAEVAMRFIPKLRNEATVDRTSARSNGPLIGSPILLNSASAGEKIVSTRRGKNAL
jgi:hypothetical protein